MNKAYNMIIFFLIILNAFLISSRFFGHNAQQKTNTIEKEKTESPFSFLENSQLEPLKISILNGCGVPGAANLVAEKIKKEYGVEIYETDNADNFNYASTNVVYNASSGSNIENFITLISENIGEENISPSTAPMQNESIIIIVGKDYQDFLNFY